MHGTHTLMNARYHLGRWSELGPVAKEHLDAMAKEPGIGCPYVRCGPLFAALALAHQGRLDAPTGSRRPLRRVSTAQNCRKPCRLLPRCAR